MTNECLVKEAEVVPFQAFIEGPWVKDLSKITFLTFPKVVMTTVDAKLEYLNDLSLRPISAPSID